MGRNAKCKHLLALPMTVAFTIMDSIIIGIGVFILVLLKVNATAFWIAFAIVAFCIGWLIYITCAVTSYLIVYDGELVIAHHNGKYHCEFSNIEMIEMCKGYRGEAMVKIRLKNAIRFCKYKWCKFSIISHQKETDDIWLFRSNKLVSILKRYLPEEIQWDSDV